MGFIQMPGRTSKYSARTNGMLKLAALDVLNTYPYAMTISDICVRDMSLNGQTTQKMSRVLNELVEMGLVKKAKSRSKKRMVYMATCHLDEAMNIEDQDFDDMMEDDE